MQTFPSYDGPITTPEDSSSVYQNPRSSSESSRVARAGLHPTPPLLHSNILTGALTLDNLDDFMTAFLKLRAQVHALTAGSRGAGSEPTELKALSLFREASDRLERLFRNVLEQETQAADVPELLRCASEMLEAAEGTPTTSGAHTGALVSESDSFCFQTSDSADWRPPSQTDSSSSERAEQGTTTLSLFPPPDDDSIPETSSISSHPGSSWKSLGSLPLFPPDDDEEDGGPYLQEDTRALARGPHTDSKCSGASPLKHEICADVTIPGVVWDSGTPREHQILARGEAVTKLRRVAKGMMDSGLEDSCLRIYRDIRGLKVATSLKSAGNGPRSRQEVDKFGPLQLKEIIKKWKRQMILTMRSVIPAERNLCLQVFSSATRLADQALQSIGEEVLAVLLPVPESLAESLKAEAKLELLLELYETLEYLTPVCEEAFPEAVCTQLRYKATGILEKGKRAVKEGIRKFNDFIDAYDLDETSADGSYPQKGLAAYVMETLQDLSRYKGALETIYPEPLLKEVLQSLLSNLQKSIERQAKKYEDPAKAEFFVMNSLRYMIVVMKDVSLKEVIGERWSGQMRKKVMNHAQAYQDLAWRPLWQLLDPSMSPASPGSDGNSPPLPGRGVSVRNLFRGHRDNPADNPRDRILKFNQGFIDLHREHRSWFIPDPKLKGELRSLLESQLWPRYEAYLQEAARAGSGFLRIRQRDQNLGFTKEKMQKMLGELFEGIEPDQIVL